LLRALVEKNVLLNAEARTLLIKTASALDSHEYTFPVKRVAGIILNDF
jgi:hypothetical protein